MNLTKATISLSETEIKEAIKEAIRARGMVISGPVFLSHYGGKPYEPEYFTAKVDIDLPKMIQTKFSIELG